MYLSQTQSPFEASVTVVNAQVAGDSGTVWVRDGQIVLWSGSEALRDRLAEYLQSPITEAAVKFTPTPVGGTTTEVSGTRPTSPSEPAAPPSFQEPTSASTGAPLIMPPPNPGITQQIQPSSTVDIPVQVASMSTVSIGGGSGVYLGEANGAAWFMTADHVITSTDDAQFVEFFDGTELPIAEVVPFGESHGVDLSLVRVDSDIPSNFAPAVLRSSLPAAGEELHAAGFMNDELSAGQNKIDVNERQLPRPDGFSLRIRQVSATDERWTPDEGSLGYSSEFVGTTPGVWKGMSGGPLLDIEGRVVGLNSVNAFPLFSIGEQGNRKDNLDYFVPMATILPLIRPYLEEASL